MAAVLDAVIESEDNFSPPWAVAPSVRPRQPDIRSYRGGAILPTTRTPFPLPGVGLRTTTSA